MTGKSDAGMFPKHPSPAGNPPLAATAGSLPLQLAAHAVFILWGGWLWIRWIAGVVLFGGRFDRVLERKRLLSGVRRYLGKLNRWGLLQTEFIGFEDASSWAGTLVVANHPTILDALLLMTVVPSLEFLINARLVNHPVMGGAMRLSGFLRNDAPLGMIRSGGKTLSAGANLLVFPEGTRTRNPPLDRFHHGYALVAIRSEAPVRTVFITCDSDYFGRDFSFFKPGRSPVRFRISAGQIFRVSGEDDPRALSGEIEQSMRSVLGGRDPLG